VCRRRSCFFCLLEHSVDLTVLPVESRVRCCVVVRILGLRWCFKFAEDCKVQSNVDHEDACGCTTEVYVLRPGDNKIHAGCVGAEGVRKERETRVLGCLASPLLLDHSLRSLRAWWPPAFTLLSQLASSLPSFTLLPHLHSSGLRNAQPHSALAQPQSLGA
jgi:hypothetical protein